MRKHAGKLIIVSIFLFGFGSAAISIWYRHTQTAQVLDYYGGAMAEMIAGRNSTATLYRLLPEADTDEPAAEQVALWTTEATIARQLDGQKEVTETPGFQNARNAITLDRSYDWTDTKAAKNVDWRYALRIEQKDRQATLIFSDDCQYVMMAAMSIGDETMEPPTEPSAAYGKAVRAAAMGRGILTLFAEQFEEPKAVTN